MNLGGTPETIQLDPLNNSVLLTICPMLSGTVIVKQYIGIRSMGLGCTLNFQPTLQYAYNNLECIILPTFSHLEYFDFSICAYSVTRIHSVNIWNLLDGHLLSGFPVYC